MGVDLYPWQREVMDDWLALDGTAGPVASARTLSHITCILEVPRRNGKNEALLVREVFGAVLRGEKVLHTAHRSATVREMYDLVCSVAGRSENDQNARNPWLNARVTNVRSSWESMGFTFEGGGSIRFATRTNSGGRGTGYDLLVVDEAQEYTSLQQEAMDAITDACPTESPQIIYTGTPPEEGGVADVFGRIRSANLAGTDGYTCLHEWAVDEPRPNEDREAWYLTNPSLGYHLKERTLEAKARTMTNAGFNRERLGLWPQSALPNPVSPELWSRGAVAKEDAPKGGRVSFAVKFAVDGESCALAACRLQDDGSAHVELVDVGAGSGDAVAESLAEWLDCSRAVACAVAVDGKSVAPALVQKLKDRKFPPKALLSPGPKGVGESFALMLDALKEGTLTHIDQPALTGSAIGCVRRKVGSGGAMAFGGTPECDSTPMEAAALALWAAKNAKRDTRRKAVVW